MACPQRVYRDLRRFALAFVTSRGRRQKEVSAGGRVASSQAHGMLALARVAEYAGGVSPHALLCCSLCRRVVAGSGRLFKTALILTHTDAMLHGVARFARFARCECEKSFTDAQDPECRKQCNDIGQLACAIWAAGFSWGNPPQPQSVAMRRHGAGV
jgi:hypothetical protein